MSGRPLDDYNRSMDEKDPVTLAISMEELAKKVEDMSYGTRRFLAKLVVEREKREAAERAEGDGYVSEERTRLTQAIREVLEAGGY